MKSVRLSDPNHLTLARIDEILCKGAREDFEELAVHILRETISSTAMQWRDK